MERTRIARDIHDDLGATLTCISLPTQTVQRQASTSDESVRWLDQLRRTERDLTSEMDEFVRAVSPWHDTLESLVHYLTYFAQEHLSAAGIACRLGTPVAVPHLPVYAKTRHHLLFAFRKAIHNAVKHAVATRALVAVRLEYGYWLLVVAEDNGRGLPEVPTPEAARRNRLSIMQKRMDEIGGACRLEPVPDWGLRVTLEVYFRPRAPRRWAGILSATP